MLENSVQINNGFTQTSADGASLAFDSKYGMMFCAYMPGPHGHYGESRGRISLSVFPASQPTNIRFVDIAYGNDEYCPNILGLGEGKVRVIYEKNSIAEGDHSLCYKDYDFVKDELSDEKVVMVKKEGGTLVPLSYSVQAEYLEANGCYEHTYMKTEQHGHCAFFKDEKGYTYGAAVNYLSEVVLYRSTDNMETVKFFAIYPKPVQYEFEYRFLAGNIYAIYRTNKEKNSISYTVSKDMGKTWSTPVDFRESIQCRPRMLVYHDHILMAYNYFNDDTQNRPAIQQGRTSVRICYGENENPNENIMVADLYSKCGIVNICLVDIMNDLYMAYSTSELALEYQNGNPKVRGKDAIRYVKLGDLIPTK